MLVPFGQLNSTSLYAETLNEKASSAHWTEVEADRSRSAIKVFQELMAVHSFGAIFSTGGDDHEAGCAPLGEAVEDNKGPTVDIQNGVGYC